uniref:Guanine nucleotide exchange factor MSS4 n=1 Tax=Cavia porcellus TaxID=10141 RepID=H0VIJ1_CAVPO
GSEKASVLQHRLVCSSCSLPLQLFLPSMRKKPALADGSNPDGDLLQDHWLVNDMFTFENVGFTKDVGNIKFLVCADCEIGPIGWHCLDDKNSFYVALERVSHE